MGDRRNVLNFFQGGFRPHGTIEYWTEDSLLRYVTSGPFNEQAFEALAKASKHLHAEQPFKRPFAHLTEIRESALASPEALEVFTRFLSDMRRLGNVGVAVALVLPPEVEGQGVMAPRFEHAYQSLGLPFRRFDTEAEARAWLQPLLERASTPGA